MSKPIEERMRRWKWWGEQALHSIAGFGLAALVLHVTMHFGVDHRPASTLAMLTAMGIGFLREGWQNWGDPPEIGSQEDMLVDVGAWVVGACFAPLTAL